MKETKLNSLINENWRELKNRKKFLEIKIKVLEKRKKKLSGFSCRSLINIIHKNRKKTLIDKVDNFLQFSKEYLINIDRELLYNSLTITCIYSYLNDFLRNEIRDYR